MHRLVTPYLLKTASRAKLGEPSRKKHEENVSASSTVLCGAVMRCRVPLEPVFRYECRRSVFCAIFEHIFLERMNTDYMINESTKVPRLIDQYL